MDAAVKKVISSMVLTEGIDDFMTFDFAYHSAYYDQVCGAGSIDQLTTDNE